ncbi:hypothetical protein Bbelb_218100 [Branchiostoma belcheri]|nr:hypothetical protein Bbelb_218100 [Branchiostoma belcheri]
MDGEACGLTRQATGTFPSSSVRTERSLIFPSTPDEMKELRGRPCLNGLETGSGTVLDSFRVSKNLDLPQARFWIRADYPEPCLTMACVPEVTPRLIKYREIKYREHVPSGTFTPPTPVNGDSDHQPDTGTIKTRREAVIFPAPSLMCFDDDGSPPTRSVPFWTREF